MAELADRLLQVVLDGVGVLTALLAEGPQRPGLGIDFDEELARAHPYDGTLLHLQMQEAPCDYRHENRFEGGAPRKD